MITCTIRTSKANHSRSLSLSLISLSLCSSLAPPSLCLCLYVPLLLSLPRLSLSLALSLSRSVSLPSVSLLPVSLPTFATCQTVAWPNHAKRNRRVTRRIPGSGHWRPLITRPRLSGNAGATNPVLAACKLGACFAAPSPQKAKPCRRCKQDPCLSYMPRFRVLNKGSLANQELGNRLGTG